MKFHFSLFNHGPGAVTLHDYIVILSDGLRQLGHEVGFDATRMDTEAVNVLFEYFTPEIAAALRASNCKYAVVATEHPGPGTDGQIKLNDRTDADWPQRSAGFLEVAKGAEFVWSMWPQTEDFYRQHTKAAYLELGWSADLELEYASYQRADTPPDIDFAFCGVLTPHRLAILDGLQQRGAIVAHKPGLIPVAERNALMARSKVILCPKQHATWPLGSASRVAGALHAGRLPAQEPVPVLSRPCNLVAEPDGDTPYIEWLMSLRDRPWADAVAVRREVYAAEMPCKLTMERALDGAMEKA